MRVLALLAIAAVALLAACGGSSPPPYLDALDREAARFDRAESAWAAARHRAAGVDTGDERARVLGSGARALEKSLGASATRLARLRPPASVRADHDRLVAGVRALHENATRLATAVASRSDDRVRAVQRSFPAEAGRRADRALSDIRTELSG